jgi:7,8-dihydropterin-6-yl-methyl-4-(beta-D-ribofuranosyl)aminobenzene 5'-phosphate synthase
MMARITASLVLLCLSGFTLAAGTGNRDVRITVLSTMVTDYGSPRHATLGEWGFSALVEVNGRKLLFDTGRTPKLVYDNARALGVRLSDVEDVILSHFHSDHTGGLLYLRETLTRKNPAALSRLHVNAGFFAPRRAGDSDEESNQMIAERKIYEDSGGTVVIHGKATEILPGVWLSGPVPRQTKERNWSGQLQVLHESDWVEDVVKESLSLFIDTPQGIVLLSGCGHAGIVNITRRAGAVTGTKKIHAAIGGFHLLHLDEEALAWTAAELEPNGIDHFMGAHCTGLEATWSLRGKLGLSRKQMVNGAVGARFVYGEGLHPTMIAQ